MDFNDIPEEAKYREEVRAWLEANVPTAEELEGLDPIEQAKLWQKRKYDAGWACLRWPKEYGGRDASAIEQVIWNQEEAKFDTPGGIFAIGQGMAAPTLMAWGTEEQKAEYLPRLASGEDIWCQLFSEPAGGSDLAALRTRSERDGDDWVINGQKIWTSGAHYSDYGILVTRSDPNVPKHKGLTYFFLSMKSPGVEVRPIKQISGGANFNEVYFTDVRIPDSPIGGGGGGGAVGGFQSAFELAQKVMIDDRPAIEDRAVRAKLADWYCQESGMRFTGYRSMSALSRGDTPGPENSIGKYVNASKSQDIASFCMDLLEMAGTLAEPGFDANLYVQSFMGAPGIRIAGGTDEVMLKHSIQRGTHRPIRELNGEISGQGRARHGRGGGFR
ncbi:MAG: acyl-CoA dehydrogenase family protein [Gammaproteobacteria bacterium]